MTRREEVEAGLARVRDRIAAACSDVGRDPAEERLLVVTKFFPPSDVRLLAELGVTDVGENRHQEAQEKSAVLRTVKRTIPASGALLLRTSITSEWRRASTQLPPLPVDRLDIIQLTSSDIWGAPQKDTCETQLRRVNSTIAASDGVADCDGLINALTPS